MVQQNDDFMMDLDFGDSDPIQKMGGFSDHIPEGPYRFRIEDVTKGETRKHDPMLTVTSMVTAGEYAGKRVQDRFPFGKDSSLGRDRFHGFLLALSGKSFKGQRVNFDIRTIIGREFVGEVQDNEFETSRGNIVTNSQMVSYYHPTSQDAARLFQPRNGAAPPAAPAPPAAAAATKPAAQQPDGDPFDDDGEVAGAGAGDSGVAVGAAVADEIENIFGN